MPTDTTTAALSTSASATSDPQGTTWAACIGPAKWLHDPLQRILSYPKPLPVQQAIIPTITRALLSGVPNDVSLTAPTGSGKTLCYLLPLLRLLSETKKGVNDNALRCLILVPTASLGQQVHRELQRLTRPTSIQVACLCAEGGAREVGGEAASAAALDAVEARELVRRVVLPTLPGSVAATAEEASDASESEEGEWEEATDGPTPLQRCSSHGEVRVRYFSNVDVIVATPHRLLHHLDHTRGLSLVDLRLLVIDEADQVLAGNFASQVQKVNTRYEYEVERHATAQRRQQQRTCTALTTRMLSAKAVSSVDHLSSSSHSSSASDGGRVGAGSPLLHKMLCSATLSSRIARISQVKLRNCSYYVLDSNGTERKEEAAVAVPGDSGETATTAKAKAPTAMAVRTQFALPPTLQEHILFVEDAYRPAVLLKLVHVLRERIAAAQQRARASAATATAPPVDAEEKESSKHGSEEATALSTSADYPSTEDKAGTGILIFCATAEEARVMSHFLAAAGIISVVEFTTLASEAERRRALLQRTAPASPGGGTGGVDDVSIVVASDALMRGIDIPNVGHVIMYHPPDAVSQYVHRAGRTARAMRPGHVHLLLSKIGASGAQEDGEMALYKRLSQSLSRTLPVSYERLFFRFTEAPARANATADAHATAANTNNSKSHGAVATNATVSATKTGGTAAKPTAGSAEWWVAQADQFLQKSQHQLQRRWASVLESASAIAAAAHKKQQMAALKPTADSATANEEKTDNKRRAMASSPSSASSTSTAPAATATASVTRKRAHLDEGKPATTRKTE